MQESPKFSPWLSSLLYALLVYYSSTPTVWMVIKMLLAPALTFPLHIWRWQSLIAWRILAVFFNKEGWIRTEGQLSFEALSVEYLTGFPFSEEEGEIRSFQYFLGGISCHWNNLIIIFTAQSIPIIASYCFICNSKKQFPSNTFKRPHLLTAQVNTNEFIFHRLDYLHFVPQVVIYRHNKEWTESIPWHVFLGKYVNMLISFAPTEKGNIRWVTL